MSWVVWRQYRAAAAITAALIAAFAALVVVTGVQAASQWHSALSACTASRTCGNLSSSTLFLGSHATGFLVIEGSVADEKTETALEPDQPLPLTGGPGEHRLTVATSTPYGTLTPHHLHYRVDA